MTYILIVPRLRKCGAKPQIPTYIYDRDNFTLPKVKNGIKRQGNVVNEEDPERGDSRRAAVQPLQI
jgi:hypothetical protein